MAENTPKHPIARTGPRVVDDPPPPPDHLGKESARHWTAAVEGWVLGADAVPVLLAACECWDRYAAARDLMADEGPTVVHASTGALQTHPAWQVCRDSLREWRQLWRQLALEPPTGAGR